MADIDDNYISTSDLSDLIGIHQVTILRWAKLGIVDIGGIVMTDLKQLPEASSKAKRK